MERERTVRAILFDLDGVILTTDRYHEAAWARLAKEIGVQFDWVDPNRLRGVSRLRCVDILLEASGADRYSAQERMEFGERKNRYYRSLIADMSPADVSNEVRETLAELRRRGYRLAIGSVSRNAGYILEKTGVMDAFDAISDGNCVQNAKPDPEVFLKAAEMLGVAPHHCAVVEDAVTGLEAAERGGMLPIGIGPAKDSTRAVYSIAKLGDLLSIF